MGLLCLAEYIIFEGALKKEITVEMDSAAMQTMQTMQTLSSNRLS